jgi:hypothetical protein
MDATSTDFKAAADQFLAWQEQHIAAAEHNLVVSTVYSLTSHYKDTVPNMPALVFYATMNSSGKTTAGQAVMDAGNFAPETRTVTKLSAASIIRLADETKKGVPIEDAHRFHPKDNIFDFIVNSFPRYGTLVLANQKDQKKLVRYAIGGAPKVVTTNVVGKLDQDVVRRSILLPMIRQAPKKKATFEERERALKPIWEVFTGAVEVGAPLVAARLGDPMPPWMNEAQYDRWQPLFAVSRALLGADWTARLDAAAQHLEGVTYTPNQMEELLGDIWEIKSALFPDSIGILPGELYKRLKEVNEERWGEMTPTRLGTLVRSIQDAQGRRLERQNTPAQANVAGWAESRGAKFFPWAHFEAAWQAYGIERPVYSEAA